MALLRCPLGVLLLDVKHLEKFLMVFGGHLVSMNIPLFKE